MFKNSEVQVKFKEILKRLWNMDELDIAYEGNPNFIESKDNLIKLLTENAEQARSLLDTLNFNNLEESYILNFIPDIVEKFKTLGEQKLFVSRLKSLQKKFDNINFSPAIFYAELSYKV